MKSITFLIILLIGTVNLYSQDYYSHVDRAIWVVNNNEASKAMWQNLGFESFVNHGKVVMQNQVYKDRNIQIETQMMSANLGGFHLTWLQPESKKNAFTSFYDKNGEGAMALMFRIPEQNYETEINKIKNLGIKTLQQGSIQLAKGDIEYILFDTEEKGKYSIGLITGYDDLEDTSDDNLIGMNFSQFAFVINEYKSVSDYWEQFGFPAFKIDYPVVHDKRYYEKEADFAMILGWQEHTDIAFEWTVPTVPPTVYADHIKKFGAGIQHFGFGVENMDESIQFMKDKGYKVSMSGGWGTKGQPGSGRFAYIDLEETGGESIELLWNYK